MRIWLAAVAAFGLGTSGAAEPALDISITPAAADAAGHVPWLDIDIRAEGLEAAAGDTVLRLPVRANNVPTSANDITGLVVSDDRGPLALTAGDKSEDDSNQLRQWQAQRAVSGTVSIRYRVSIDSGLPLLNLPQYELRTGDGAFSGAGNAFLILPDDKVARETSIRWNLAAMDPGATAASSLGIGAATSSQPLTSDRLSASYFAAGKLRLHRGDDGFFAVLTGSPPFDAAAVMDWAGRLHRYYGQVFQESAPRFGVFGRPNPQNPGSGIGLTDSFAFTYGPQSTADDLKGLLAHEMLHSWVRSLDESMDKPGGLDRSWFGEGLAVYYQRLLPWRAGLIDDQAFLDDLNQTAGRYYTNIMIGLPNRDIPTGFWRDTRIRVLPYDRGSLYFAVLDARIRKASGGKRSVDDLVRAMLAARRSGKPMNEALWRQLLRAELGEAGERDFDAMLTGAVMLPPSDAFGPCFERVAKPLRRFDLGFDPDSLLARPRLVKGVKPGSEAARAGLRDGDVITTGFSQDGMQGDQQAVLKLAIRRDGRTLEIAYQPRGETVSAWQWQAKPGCTTAPETPGSSPWAPVSAGTARR